MAREKRNQNGLEGIQKSYLEERLLVYGTVLFPHGDDFIDLAVVDAYLAKRERGENPTILLLTNTYYTLSYCWE
ncbi:hypothetical protein CR513_25257, partial [Mucuna pruriens]